MDPKPADRQTEAPGNPTSESPKTHFWKLGMRTWKTVIAVFVTLLVDGGRAGAFPFYGAIAAIICTQKTRQASFEAAVNREVATIVGGLFGLLFLLCEVWFGHVDIPIVRYMLLALTLVPIISFSVWIGRQQGTLLMCIVFLSVALVHETDMNPYTFTLNRVLDTSIGIAIALVVNELPDRLRQLFRNK